MALGTSSSIRRKAESSGNKREGTRLEDVLGLWLIRSFVARKKETGMFDTSREFARNRLQRLLQVRVRLIKLSDRCEVARNFSMREHRKRLHSLNQEKYNVLFENHYKFKKRNI